VSGENWVPYPPLGLVVAIQYWREDEAPALRLARLLADIEPARREDVTIAFCRRFDTERSELLAETFGYCAAKFRVQILRSEREGTGHPDGCFGLWAGTMDQLAEQWSDGRTEACSVFTVEADGVPLCTDWLDRLRYEHGRALRVGKRVTGAFTEGGGEAARLPHINGSLIAHLSLWPDRPSLHRTPAGQAWDVFHAPALLAEAQPTPLIKNVYGARAWAPETLKAMAKETAWLSSCKDVSAFEWAEQTLVPAR